MLFVKKTGRASILQSVSASQEEVVYRQYVEKFNRNKKRIETRAKRNGQSVSIGWPPSDILQLIEQVERLQKC